MNRLLALLLAIVGGAIAAMAVVLSLGGALLGVLWVFVFGDDPWPEGAVSFLNLAIPIAGLLLWAIIGLVIWRRLTGPPATG